MECRDSREDLSTSCDEESKPESKKPCSTGISCDFHGFINEEISRELYETEPLVQPYPDPPAPARLIGDQIVPSEST